MFVKCYNAKAGVYKVVTNLISFPFPSFPLDSDHIQYMIQCIFVYKGVLFKLFMTVHYNSEIIIFNNSKVEHRI